MSSIINRACLVLNKEWSPTDINTVGKVFSRVMNEKFVILHPETLQPFKFSQWVNKDVESEYTLHIKDLIFDIPEIVVATACSHRNDGYIIWSPKNVCKRDNYTCQYCQLTRGMMKGQGLTPTIDHIIPRCNGGKDKFDNTVVACSKCNSKKSDMSVKAFCDQNNFAIPHPVDPNKHPWAFKMGRNHPKSWDKFLN